MKVEQLMTKEVFTCRPEDTLQVAAQILWEHDCGCVPVVTENSQVAGMITDRDICMAAYTQGKPLYDLPVSLAMSKTVISCRPEDPLAAAAEIMKANKVRRLLVVGPNRQLAGLLSINDLALEAYRQKNMKKKEITEEEIAETLAAICAHPIAKEMATAA